MDIRGNQHNYVLMTHQVVIWYAMYPHTHRSNQQSDAAARKHNMFT